MNPPRRYNTNLSKAQGVIPETIELLGVWEPGMSAAQLKSRVRSTGALGKATQTRVDDIVSRAFVQRYLIEEGRPAKHLKPLAASGSMRGVLRQLVLLYTARSQPVLRDFITDVYWAKVACRAGEVTKEDARDFLERATATGRSLGFPAARSDHQNGRGPLSRPTGPLSPAFGGGEGRGEEAWSPGTTERMARNLLGTLADFEWIVANRRGRRQIRPPSILPGTVLYLAYDLHFHGVEAQALLRHPDWALFGLMPAEVLDLLNQMAAQGHAQVQSSGALLRIEWGYPDMESVIDAILDRKV